MAFSKLTGKGIDLSTDIITEFNSTGVDDNATATTITLNANNTATIPNVTGNTTFNEYITVTNLTVNNDASISNDLTVGGNFIITGNTFTVDSTSLKIEDSLIHLAGNNVSSDIVDIGFIGHYSNDSGNTELFTGFYRDATDEQYYLFNGLSDDINTATTIDKTGAGFTLASLNVGAITSDGAGYFNYTKVDNGAVYNSFSGASGVSFSSTGTTPCDDSGSLSDDTHDLGRLANRWQDLYLSNSISLTNATTSSFLQVSTNILQFGTSSTDALAIYTDNTERLRINSSGNVGIGTDSPATRLHVRADTGSSDSIMRIRNENTTARTTTLQLEDYSGALADGVLKFVFPNAGSTTDSYLALLYNSAGLYIAPGGNVGIGTSTPGNSLDISAGATSRVRTTDGTRELYSGVWASQPRIQGTNGTLNISSAGSYDISFDTQGSEVMRINSSGNVGIGTNTMAAKLHVISSSSRLQQWERSSNQVALEMSTVASGGWGFYDIVSAQYDIYGKNRKIGVGTSNPGGNLTINSGGATTTMTMESSWTSGIARIAFTGGSGGVDGSSQNSTAGKIESHASAPGGAATGELKFFTNQGDTFVEALRMDPYGQMYAHSWIDQGSGQTLTTTTTLNSTTFYNAKRVARTPNSDRFEAIVTHSGAWNGTEYMHIVFDTSGTIPFKFDVNTGRSGSERAFGKVTYECYFYWESDGDFRHFACSSAETTQNYSYMLRALDLPSGYVADDATGTSENGSSIWNYFVVRVPLNANMQGSGDIEVYFNLETQRRYNGNIYVGFV